MGNNQLNRKLVMLLSYLIFKNKLRIKGFACCGRDDSLILCPYRFDWLSKREKIVHRNQRNTYVKIRCKEKTVFLKNQDQVRPYKRIVDNSSKTIIYIVR